MSGGHCHTNSAELACARDALPTGSLTFLRAVGTVVAIREARTAAGYNQAEQDYGWQLVLNVSGTGRRSRAPAVPKPGKRSSSSTTSTSRSSSAVRQFSTAFTRSRRPLSSTASSPQPAPRP